MAQMEVTPEAYGPVLENLFLQFERYDNDGFGRALDGANYAAAMTGASQRFAAETAKRAGITVEELSALSDAEGNRILDVQILMPRGPSTTASTVASES